jgi:GT2 family glycosyltransferase
MHDDISYHTPDWGQRVINHFNNINLSAIGVGGSPYLSYMPGPWWGSGHLYETILQSSEAGSHPVLKDNSNGTLRRQAITIDGVWMCVRKSLFNTVKFDDENFDGFHWYDADLSMQLFSNNYQTYCVNDILISHNSLGSVDSNWIDNCLKFQKKWKNHLPAKCITLSYDEMCRAEFRVLNSFIWICFNNGWSNFKTYASAIKYLTQNKKVRFFYKAPGYMVKFILKMLFKKGAPFSVKPA